MKPPIKFYPIGNHHFYYGVSFFIFGLYNFILGYNNGNLSSISWFWELLMGIGISCMIDDFIEHNITASTPMRIAYDFLFKIKE